MPTTGDPIPLGVFSLSDLCGCPDPCPDCCGVEVCGCANVPTTLNVTFADGANCACAGGGGTLEYDSGTNRWIGSASVGSCGTTLDMEFYCSGTMSDPSEFRMDFSGCFVSIAVSPASASCDPFQVEFHIAASACCGATAQLNVIVTF